MDDWGERDSGDVEDLARRAAAGDEVALERLLSEIQPRVRRICGRMLLFPEDAEEATQDALMLVATKIGTFRGQSRFTTWLHTVASNSARGTYRSLRRRAAERTTDELPVRADPRTTSVIAGSRLDLLDALEDLTQERPEVVDAWVLRDVHHLDYADIAEVLDVPLGTVKSRIHAARQALRPRLLVTE